MKRIGLRQPRSYGASKGLGPPCERQSPHELRLTAKWKIQPPSPMRLCPWLNILKNYSRRPPMNWTPLPIIFNLATGLDYAIVRKCTYRIDDRGAHTIFWVERPHLATKVCYEDAHFGQSSWVTPKKWSSRVFVWQASRGDHCYTYSIS